MKHLLAPLFLSISLVGCAAQHSKNPGVAEASVAPTSMESLQAFQTTVYNFGRTQGCVSCHANTVNPTWLRSDLSIAYDFARPFLDLNDPAASTFATYVANGHCGNPVCMDAANIPIMQDLLTQWAELEIEQAGEDPPVNGLTLSNPPYRTATVPIPANLPLLTATNPAVIRFDLSQMTPAVPALSGAVLELSIRAYNSVPTTYKVYNMRIAGAASLVTLQGIHVYVRPATGSGLGSEDTSTGLEWSQMSILTSMSPVPAPLPTGPMTSVPASTGSKVLAISVQSPSDVITVGFAQVN